MSSIKQKAILKFKDNSFVDSFYSVLQETGKVKVQGIGIFEIRKMKPRKGYNVGSGKSITIPAHNKVSFRPLKRLKDFSQKHAVKN